MYLIFIIKKFFDRIKQPKILSSLAKYNVRYATFIHTFTMMIC